MIIRHLFISPGHNFFGRHGQAAGEHTLCTMNEIECVAGHGLSGDRFYDYGDNYKGQITFFASEVFEDVCRRLGVQMKSPSVARRNVVTAGIDLNSLIGKLHHPGRGVRRGLRMQALLLDGLRNCAGGGKALQGRGGLRANPLQRQAQGEPMNAKKGKHRGKHEQDRGETACKKAA